MPWALGLMADSSPSLASVFSHFASGSDVKTLAPSLLVLRSGCVHFHQKPGLKASVGDSDTVGTSGKEVTIPLFPGPAESQGGWASPNGIIFKAWK